MVKVKKFEEQIRIQTRGSEVMLQKLQNKKFHNLSSNKHK